MIDYALKNLKRRWLRSLLTVIGISVLVALTISITGIVSYQKKTMDAHASAGIGRISVQSRLAGMTYPALTIDLSKAMSDRLLEWDGIQKQISGKVLFFALKPRRFPIEPPEMILCGVEVGKEKGFTGSIASETRPMEGSGGFAGTKTTHPVILGFHAKEILELEKKEVIRIGEKINILDQSFTVVGILEHSADKVVNNALVVPLKNAQALLGKENEVSAVILYAEHAGEKERIIKEIKQEFRNVNIVTQEQVSRNAREGIKAFEQLINIISIVVVASTVILIVTVLMITIRERTREFGVLRAIGAARLMLIRTVFWEILLMSLTGCLIGGAIAAFVLKYAMIDDTFDLWHIFKILPLSIVITVFSGIGPTIKISRIPPVESLRYE